MRGVISMVPKRHAKANNPHTADYDPAKETNYIMYYDANNLYGWALLRLQMENARRKRQLWQKNSRNMLPAWDSRNIINIP